MYTLVFNTGVLFEDYNNWDDKAEGDKMWENFKYHFIDAKRRYKHRQREANKWEVSMEQNTSNRPLMDV